MVFARPEAQSRGMTSSKQKEPMMPGWISFFSPFYIPPAGAPGGPGSMLRARVWMRQLELDAAIAGGADPARSEELALRAKQLPDRSTRDRLASTITHLVRIADGQRAAITTPGPPFRPQQVRANRSLLLELAARLQGPGSVALRGMALTSLLLNDGRGPLTSNSDPVTLERAVRTALSALNVDRDPRQGAQSPVGMDP
jgi:hypothetical protein